MSELATLAQPVAVVCHDAGAANIVLAQMLAAPDVFYLPVMQGPALKIFTDSGFYASALLSLDEALTGARSVVTGTGWASNLEHDARSRAKALSLHNVAVIDHWVNYAARFERSGQLVLPDEVWVTDAYAFGIASNTFMGMKIRQCANRYLDRQVQKIAPVSNLVQHQVLYVLEPLRFSWPGCKQSGEFEALDFFANSLGKISTGHELKIRLRPHPSDAPDKYRNWLAKNQGHDILMDDSSGLSEAIGRAEWVAGCETAAMVLALAARRKVLCTLPPDAPWCRLPHAGIVHLRDL